ncbi:MULTISPECIES: hypothetical protein, partial [unclassified Burkholderia]|uniref:hypothetical protein n=1 Tax=Burkholderia sp. LMG 13014 TaxID=2709306 RepID=UPI001965F8F3
MSSHRGSDATTVRSYALRPSKETGTRDKRRVKTGDGGAHDRAVSLVAAARIAAAFREAPCN